MLRGRNLADLRHAGLDLLVVAPVAAVIYFLVYPDQFGELLAWLARLSQ